MIAPFGSAGGTDIVARLIGQWLSERLGQPFVIENRPGAGGNLGIEAVVRSPPDGYTLAVIGLPSAINVTLYENLSFNLTRDTVPVGGIVRFPDVMIVNPSIPARTVPKFIAYAKANPGKLNMSSPGSGSTPHMFGELFKMMTGINLVHIPYRSMAAALTDMLSGQVQVTFATSASTIEYVRAGTLRALAVTTARRSEFLPDLPAMRNRKRLRYRRITTIRPPWRCRRPCTPPPVCRISSSPNIFFRSRSSGSACVQTRCGRSTDTSRCRKVRALAWR
jgi:tripartite-type tricarboxylate transporter receptor subunit TctC